MSLCACGCGRFTSTRFVHGHNRRRRGIVAADYVVEDRGFRSPCWVWIGSPNEGGYGRVTHRGAVRLAHRVAYEQWVGPIPDGYELDHLCRVPACIRPDHLEPVTHAENVQRGLAGDLRTTCQRGHLWIPANQISNGPGRKTCGPCKRQREQRRRVAA